MKVKHDYQAALDEMTEWQNTDFFDPPVLAAVIAALQEAVRKEKKRAQLKEIMKS